jgi:hypothetical protein
MLLHNWYMAVITKGRRAASTIEYTGLSALCMRVDHRTITTRRKPWRRLTQNTVVVNYTRGHDGPPLDDEATTAARGGGLRRVHP